MRRVSWSCLNSGVPVKPMNEAFGSARRMLRANLPACVRCASSEIDDDVVALAVGLGHILVELVDQAEDEAVVLPRAAPASSSPELARGVFSSATPQPTNVRQIWSSRSSRSVIMRKVKLPGTTRRTFSAKNAIE